MKIMAKLSLLSVIFLTLQSCFFVAGAAAGAAAITIVYDQRSVDSVLQDQRIARVILQRIHSDPDLRDNTYIEVTSFGQVVLLTGQAPGLDLRQKAERTARTVRGIRRIYNAIAIQGPTSALTHASDTWITTKIKTEMLATPGLKSASIKVVTENGTVYVMGTISRLQEETILNIVRHVNGVQKVVKIFQYKPIQTQMVTVSQPEPSTNTENDNSQANMAAETQPLISG